MVRWLRWHCPPDTGFEIRALAVWGRARYLSVTEAPHNTNFHTWMGKKQFCFFQTAETGNRTPDSGVKGSGANHYPRAPALVGLVLYYKWVKKKRLIREIIHYRSAETALHAASRLTLGFCEGLWPRPRQLPLSSPYMVVISVTVRFYCVVDYWPLL